MAGDGREYPQHPRVGIGVALLRHGKGPSGAPEWQILLIRRAHPPAAGQWSLPGGAQHLGETAEAAARRELLEETGLVCGPLVLAGIVDSLHRDPAGLLQYHYTIIDFAGLYAGGTARPGDDADGVLWAGPGQFEALGLWSEARRIYEASLTALGLASLP